MFRVDWQVVAILRFSSCLWPLLALQVGCAGAVGEPARPPVGRLASQQEAPAAREELRADAQPTGQESAETADDRAGRDALAAALGSEDAALGSKDAALGSEDAALGPDPRDPAVIAAGQAEFERTCGSCHPAGAADIGPALIDRHLTETRVRAQIRDGSDRMRPIPDIRLSDAQIPALMAYLRTIGAVSAGDEDDSPGQGTGDERSARSLHDKN